MTPMWTPSRSRPQEVMNSTAGYAGYVQYRPRYFLTLTWTHLQDIDTGDTPLEHLYNNECWGYDRAPGTYLIFPSRYVAHRMPDPYWYVRISLNDSDLFAFRFR